jgi:hypothetical protein
VLRKSFKNVSRVLRVRKPLEGVQENVAAREPRPAPPQQSISDRSRKDPRAQQGILPFRRKEAERNREQAALARKEAKVQTPMPDDAHSSEPGPDQTVSGPLPLGRNASRALVIGSILFALAFSAGGTWLILSLARSGPPPQQEVAPPPADTTADTTAAPAP